MTRKVIVMPLENAEDNAMLQALYSRSNASVETHKEKLDKTGSGKFMERYYIGYGHASIGDCGSTTIYIEGVSHLVAKAFQDNKMYSGQESSTRYIDYSKAGIILPCISEVGVHRDKILDINKRWLSLYTDLLPKVKKGIIDSISDYRENDVKSVNAVNARAFDILRGFIPLGTATQFSWHTNLRQARDKLMSLAFHPLHEVRLTVISVYQQLLEKYPNSFSETDLNNRHAAKDGYLNKYSSAIHYHTTPSHYNLHMLDTQGNMQYTFNGTPLTPSNINMLNDRPKGTPLPHTDYLGNFIIRYDLDYGSYRDMQRHRNCTGGLPIASPPTSVADINPWYLNSLVRLLDGDEYNNTIDEINEIIWLTVNMVDESGFKRPFRDIMFQYCTPMATNVEVNSVMDVHQMIYVAELRSSKHVHPTLRKVAQSMGGILDDIFPGMALYVDHSPDSFNLSRGTQTITEKE